MNRIVLEAGDLPDNKPKTIETTVWEAIRDSQDGCTNSELAKITGIKPRRIREATQRLLLRDLIYSKRCRCNHTPVYHSYK